jgi:hypothetical protein
MVLGGTPAVSTELPLRVQEGTGDCTEAARGRGHVGHRAAPDMCFSGEGVRENRGARVLGEEGGVLCSGGWRQKWWGHVPAHRVMLHVAGVARIQ